MAVPAVLSFFSGLGTEYSETAADRGCFSGFPMFRKVNDPCSAVLSLVAVLEMLCRGEFLPEQKHPYPDHAQKRFGKWLSHGHISCPELFDG